MTTAPYQTAVACILWCIAATGEPAVAQPRKVESAADPLATLEERVRATQKDLVDARGTLWRRQAEVAALEAENQVFEQQISCPTPTTPQASNATSVDTEVRALCEQLVREEVTRRNRAFDDVARPLKKTADQTVSAVGDVKSRELALLRRMFESESRFGGAVGATASAWGKWFDRALQPVWITGGAALGATFVFLAVAQRRGLRRWLRAMSNVRHSRASVASLWWLALYCLIGGGMGGCIFRPAESAQLRFSARLTELQHTAKVELEKVQAELATVTGRWEVARKQNEQLREQWLNARSEPWKTALGTGNEFSKRESELLASHRAIKVDSAIIASATAYADRLIAQLEQEEAKLSAHEQLQQTVERSILQRRVAVSSGFVLAEAMVLWRAWRRCRRFTREIRHRCPRCLSTGMTRTSNLNAQCDSCGYAMRIRDLPMPRLCFPTLGVRASGKTHWMAMVYHQLNLGRTPDGTAFEKKPSLGEERELDHIVHQILNERQDPAPTPVDPEHLPEPLVFHVRDGDPLGASDMLLNLFDLSGEVMNLTIDRDKLRERALTMDGFVLCLDHTQPVDMQNRDLIRFREELRAITGIAPGKPVKVPVAVCITKLDLLASPGRAGSGILEEFIERVQQVESANGTPTLLGIRRRSRLCVDYLETIFPGWRIDKQMNQLFAGRFMFFPMTPVGLGELGVTQLADRTIEPFGIREPLLWLLHMNGYKVLS
jgi:hypothetical protein